MLGIKTELNIMIRISSISSTGKLIFPCLQKMIQPRKNGKAQVWEIEKYESFIPVYTSYIHFQTEFDTILY